MEKNILNLPEEIRAFERKLYCHLLQILPEDGTPVYLDQMFKFLNENSGLLDGIKLVSVCTTDHGHHINLKTMAIDYENTSRSVDEISAADNCFTDPETNPLRCDCGELVNVKMLTEIVDKVQKMINAKKIHVGCSDRVGQGSTIFYVWLDPDEQNIPMINRNEERFAEKTVKVDGLRGFDKFITELDEPRSGLKVKSITVI